MSIDLMEWLKMGGYAVYIWPSYALGVLVLLFNIWLPLRQHRRQLQANRKPQ